MSVDFSALRVNMVNNQLRTIDVTDPHILEAFLTIKREDFVPNNSKELAYIDDDILLSAASSPRYLMEAGPLAKLLQLACLKKTDVVLHIGAAAGYATAILAGLVQDVVAIEEDSALLEQATGVLARQHLDNIALLKAKLAEGCEDKGPFDLIFIEGSVEFIPTALFEQLKENGRLVAVEGNCKNGVAKLYIKENGVVSSRIAFNLNVKALPGFTKSEAYVF